jgi:cytochrome c-type biogenesis protein CcmH
MLAEALMTGDGGKASPAALAALGKAVEIDPKNLSARYFLARAQITSGDRAAGKAAWEALRAEIPADDPRRKVLDEDIASLLGEGAPASGAVAVAETAEQAQFIRGMVARLAARLETSPDDPEGWARLVRAYRVLGDREAEAKAVDRARKLFAGRPQDLARIEAEAAP